MIISCIVGRNNNYTNIQAFLHNGYVEVVKEGSAIKLALGTKKQTRNNFLFTFTKYSRFLHHFIL